VIMSDETKRKLRVSNTGKKRTDETKLKMSIAKSGENHPMWGTFLSEDHKIKLSIAKSGENHPNYGKSHTDEHKSKISNSMIGKIVSDETKLKMSIHQKGKPKKLLECPYCKLVGGNSNMTRYHFDKCKQKRPLS
jgi:NUMOD3 motif